MKHTTRLLFALLLLMCSFLICGVSTAQEAPPAAPVAAVEAPAATITDDVAAYFNNTEAKGPLAKKPGPGHNAWQMVSTALVLFMTLPGLALFYGGLVRKKNVLSVLAQCLGIACMVTVLWFLCGFSLCFDTSNDSAFIGGFKHAFFEGVTSDTGMGWWWISDNVWAIFQLTFAIITPALIVGAIAERMKFSAIMIFVLLWMFAVYFPMAHMVWGVNGALGGLLNPTKAWAPALDFAGGTVVHMTSGWSALVLCIILGKRRNYGKEPMPPHSMVLCMIGTGMLWVGWYGFNAGSALGADGIAATAFTTTTLAAGTAGLVWAGLEWFHRKKPSVLGFCSGIVAGLVVVTPACGFITPKSAMIIGLLAGSIPYLAVAFLKAKLGFDDALDTFGIHGVGGTMGAILTGIYADGKVNSVVDAIPGSLLTAQFKAMGVTILLSVVATAVIALLIKKTIGLRPNEEDEVMGLDLVDHGEEGYHG